jgi:hypothetical protein
MTGKQCGSGSDPFSKGLNSEKLKNLYTFYCGSGYSKATNVARIVDYHANVKLTYAYLANIFRDKAPLSRDFMAC